MKKLIFPSLLALIPLCSNSQETDSGFSIEILKDEALELIDPDTEVEIIGSGFDWTEGPLWIPKENYLLFSDIPKNTIFKIDETGKTSEYLHPSGYLGDVDYGKEPGSNGLLLSPDNELILMQHGERQVAKMNASLENPKPEYETVVGEYKGKRFNSPNDGTFDDKGNLYFTDPPYGLPQQMEDPRKELDFQGVYCLKTTGELALVDSLSRPNGIGLSPDGGKLYVAVSDPEHAVWYSYDLTGPGKIANKQVIHDVTHLIGKPGEQGLPDGLKVHSNGHLFATGPGGLWIFNPESEPIARIRTGRATANCAFSQNEKILFITADDLVLKIVLR